MSSPHMEIEKKYLIRMPDRADLENQPDVHIRTIRQTYLISDGHSTRRVRLLSENGITKYYFTEKKRINALSCFEDEYELTENEYSERLKEADPALTPIHKVRYAFPYEGHTMEIDLYDFWQDRATLEIELSSEDEEALLPPFIKVISDVTNDRRYKNAALSRHVVYDRLPE